MAKQSAHDRRSRLLKGNCPIHGLPMTQVGNCKDGAIVECSRKDCNIQGIQYLPSMEVHLTNKFCHLLGPHLEC